MSIDRQQKKRISLEMFKHIQVENILYSKITIANYVKDTKSLPHVILRI